MAGGNRAPAAKLPTSSRPLTAKDLSGFARDLHANPLIGGRLINGLVLDGSTNPNYFEHGLGRAFQGCKIVGKSGPVTVHELSADAVRGSGQDIKRVLGLQAGSAATVTVDVWCF